MSISTAAADLDMTAALDLDLPPVLTVKQLAETFGVTTKTVYEWNSSGAGPRPFRAGKHVRYTRGEVARWVQARMSEYGTNAAPADSTRPDLDPTDDPQDRP